jgi:bifunctional DNase/RNase
MRLQGLTAERPLTHDLFAASLERLGVRIARVVISELADETYHARLHLERDGTEVEIDSRPSDALALAVRTEATIFADESVLEQAALASDPDEDAALDADSDDAPGADDPDRPRRRPPLESIGDAPADPRLDMFRDFVNSLEHDQGPESGGRRS